MKYYTFIILAALVGVFSVAICKTGADQDADNYVLDDAAEDEAEDVSDKNEEDEVDDTDDYHETSDSDQMVDYPDRQLVEYKRQVSYLPVKDDCYSAHRYFRDLHSVPRLKSDDQLASQARKRAKRLMSKTIKHIGYTKHGENWASLQMGQNESCDNVVKMWYDEVKNYDFNNGLVVSNTMHFTQIVWKSTTKIGCGIERGPEFSNFVCLYEPEGNDPDKLKENVLPKNGFLVLRPDPPPATTTVKPFSWNIFGR